MRQLIDIVSNEKSFKHPLIGSPRLNRLGLHSARVIGADLCSRMRRIGAGRAASDLRARLWRDGFLVIGNLLPAALLEPARREFAQRLTEHETEVPSPRVASRGFGRRLPNDGGFDRADGGSLNRFITLDGRCPLLLGAFAENLALRGLLRALTGVAVKPDAFTLYQLVHGDETVNPDPQRQWHCDTFHDTFKLWYFFEPVTVHDGPLLFAPGTHRSGGARRRWERHQVLVNGASSSAFRVGADDLARLSGGEAPQAVLAPANSLVLANTRGFHCRGLAPEGTVRQGLYANLRPHAFGLRP
ncbi:MAG: phytanoyl-CoA dioxygenase family protein [Methylibium sp.]|nr:phytanoyl-CoA dioxygenase family protein [Methylibium sp.]